MKIGKTYKVKTFAGVVVHMKVLRYYKDDDRGSCEGCLTRQEDVIALKRAGVPYSVDEKPEDCKGVMYKFQIEGLVKTQRKKRNTRVRKTKKK